MMNEFILCDISRNSDDGFICYFDQNILIYETRIRVNLLILLDLLLETVKWKW